MREHTFTLRISVNGDAPVRVFARRQQFEVGAAVTVDAQAPQVSALEYGLGAVAAELCAGLRDRARRRRLEVFRIEAALRANLNDTLAALDVIGAEGHAGLERIGMTVYVDTLEDQATIQALWDEVLERSPLTRTLRRVVALDLELRVT